MDKIADKLRKVRNYVAGQQCYCEGLSTKCRRCRLLAGFPDPDAVGRVMRNPEHEAVCAVGRGPGRECDCGLDAALAKLEGS